MKTMFTTAALAAAIAGTLTSGSARAASFTGTTFTENFNGLPTAAAPGTVATSPFSATTGTQAIATGTTFVATRIAGTSTTALPLAVDTGTLNSGAIYSYGVTTTDADRALGTLSSGSNTPAFGIELVNNSASALASVTITLNSESYRSSTSTTNVINAQYSVGASGSGTFLSTAGTDVDALDLTGPAFVASNGAITPTQTPQSATIDFTATPIAVGQSFYLRFFDFNDVGNDAGIAIDDFTFSAVPATASAPEPTTLAAIAGLGIVGGLRRRRA